MSPEELNHINEVLQSAKNLSMEIDAMNEGKEFLLKQYKERKKWFRDEPGKVTAEDLIKTAFEFGWSSHLQFQHKQEGK